MVQVDWHGVLLMQTNIGDPEWGICHAWANDYDAETCQTYIYSRLCKNVSL